jgi:hypothetical protein
MPGWCKQVIEQRFEQWRGQIERRLLTAEAIVYLVSARLALVIFSFRQLTWFFERPTRQPELTGDARIWTRQKVRSAILKVYQRFPDKTTCLHRAIAAQAMLRRRRVSTTLYYGAAKMPDRGLAAHAWVQDGAEGVVGHLVAQQDRYHILARYPEPNSS